MNVKKSSYQQYLPAILQEDVFISQFLLAFERILSGLDNTPSKEQIITAKTQNFPGLEEIIANIHLYFDPQETPEEFLPWLAGWVALSLRDDWKEEVKRAFIQKIVKLYCLRGTKTGLIEILKLYLKSSGFGENVEVFDQFDNFPNYFQVQLTLTDRDPDKYWRQAKIAKAIIDREKPAQTFYALKILVPTMQITQQSHIAFPVNLFASLQNENFALVENLELEAIIKITQPQTITSDLLNKITLRLKDDFSDYHLFTPETIIANNQITIKRTLDAQDFIQNLHELEVTIQNLNNMEIAGQVIVQVSLNINQVLSTYEVLRQPFNLAATPPYQILQICRQNEKGEIIPGETIPTILGTTSQLLN